MSLIIFQGGYHSSNPGLSASRVGGSLMPAWAARAGKVPHHFTSTKFLALQKFYTSNAAVWDLPYLGGPSGVRLPPTLEADMPGHNTIL